MIDLKQLILNFPAVNFTQPTFTGGWSLLGQALSWVLKKHSAGWLVGSASFWYVLIGVNQQPRCACVAAWLWLCGVPMFTCVHSVYTCVHINFCTHTAYYCILLYNFYESAFADGYIKLIFILWQNRPSEVKDNASHSRPIPNLAWMTPNLYSSATIPR